VAGLKGDISSLRALKSRIKNLPLSVAHDVAQRAAPVLTSATREAFDSGRSVYGEPRPLGVDGQALDLRRTGATAAQLRFVSNGTIVRVELGPSYARYLIGKYGILPNGALPADWSKKLGVLVHETKAPA
jgi:hypothetical protein